MLEIQVGRSYVTNAFVRGDTRIVSTIVGIADPSTLAYVKGFKYIDVLGRPFNEKGHYLLSDSEHRHSLVREATRADITIEPIHRLRYDLDMCRASENFIPKGHDNFLIKLGSIVVRYDGFSLLLDSHLDMEKGPVFADHTVKQIYYSDGRKVIRGGRPTLPEGMNLLRDIAFIKVG